MKTLYSIFLFIVLLSEPCFGYQQFLPSERNNIQVFNRVSGSVVNISNIQQINNGFWSDDVSEINRGTGSGFIWDTKGHIITNAHVIANADKLLVSFSDGSSTPAKVIGISLHKDIAVLRLLKRTRVLKPVTVFRGRL